MAKNEIEKQVSFCLQMMDKLVAAVNFHETTRAREHQEFHASLYGYNGVKEAGACKCQIQADIVRLRRELDQLSAMMED